MYIKSTKENCPLSNHLEGNHRMYRNREDKIIQMSAFGGSSYNDTWFKYNRATSTLSVPATPNVILADCVRKNL